MLTDSSLLTNKDLVMEAQRDYIYPSDQYTSIAVEMWSVSDVLAGQMCICLYCVSPLC